MGRRCNCRGGRRLLQGVELLRLLFSRRRRRRWAGVWRSAATGVESMMALGRPVACGELQVEGTAVRLRRNEESRVAIWVLSKLLLRNSTPHHCSSI
ncbi:hypothetical protein ACFX2C_047354 [Malus domestica]